MNIYQTGEESIYETANMEDGVYTVHKGFRVYSNGLGTLEHVRRGTLTTVETFVHPHVFKTLQDATDFSERVNSHGKINTELWNHTGTEIKDDPPYWMTAEYAARERSDELGR